MNSTANSVWVSPWATDENQASISLRFPKDSHGLVMYKDTFPTSRANPTVEMHINIGLFDMNTLVLLRDAIDKYLGEN